jgi:hypothetical protein
LAARTRSSDSKAPSSERARIARHPSSSGRAWRGLIGLAALRWPASDGRTDKTVSTLHAHLPQLVLRAAQGLPPLGQGGASRPLTHPPARAPRERRSRPCCRRRTRSTWPDVCRTPAGDLPGRRPRPESSSTTSSSSRRPSSSSRRSGERGGGPPSAEQRSACVAVPVVRDTQRPSRKSPTTHPTEEEK